MKADCYRFSVHPKFSSGYALLYLNSPVAQEFAAAHHHGMTLTRIGLGNFRSIPFPLPPLTEQRRLVAKVHELMGLCDRLEANLIAGEECRFGLLTAILGEALRPDEERDEAA
jgi:type I restriction enzyme S subunit